jgi:predicted secreted protein
MDLFTGLLAFFLIWWVVIFCVLPWGIKTDLHGGSGAPIRPHLKKKFLITTGISLLVWVLVAGLVHAGIIDFRGMSRQMIEEDLK